MDSASVFPILRPLEWPGAPDAFCRRLLDTGDEGIPWLSFVTRSGPKWRVVSDKQAWIHTLEFDEFWRDAVSNLSSREANWSVEFEEEDAPAMLALHERITGAARMFDTALMAQGMEMLNCKSLVVAVPTLEHLFITNGEPQHLRLHVGLDEWARRQHWNAENLALSNRTFYFADGEIRGIMNLKVEGS